jgi:hypothetical protein
MLAMTGRVTMLGLSRWTEKGGSYRTIQRFFNSPIGWSKVNWFLIRHHLLDRAEAILIGGDESVVTKSGWKSYGLDRFFSSLYGKPVPGLSFFSLSLISLKARISYPVMMEQVVKAEQAQPEQKKSGQKVKKQTKKRGRPKGRKNKNRREVELTPYLRQIQTMLKHLLGLLGLDLVPVYCVLDGAFGNNNALQMVRQCSLHLISKLRYDAALYFPYDGVQKKRGATKKYGAKLDYDHIPDKYLKEMTLLDGIQTKIYQLTMWHKLIPDKLNIVIIVKTNLTTQKVARVVLFSSDLTLAFDKLIDYYRLRFQIEIVFTQMTKARFFAFGRGWDDITDFHIGIVNDDTVNQQFYQLATLGKVKLIQGWLNTLAKILDVAGQFGYIELALGLKFKLTHLLAQALLGLVQFVPLALKLIPTDDLSQEYFQQTGLLTFELCQRFFNTLAARLQGLGQPLPNLGSLQLVSNQIWVS